MDTLEYYKIIRYNIQLRDVRLISSKFENLIASKSDTEKINEHITLQLKSDVKLLNERKAEIILHAWIGFDEKEEGQAPFSFEVVYGGLCVVATDEELSPETLKKQAYDQVVPLLLPYVREFVSSTLSRMKLPIYYLPTVDVLNTLEANERAE
ncbi:MULTISPECIES: protein-export chaperone SecB [Bacillus cereus group]|uniref:protein-export chaperone SecB n=1 Tax=Bacillus cereus group TaxID=86661 RepID=UPI000BF95A33|nr:MULTISPECIES: protein-export chaperone SecB [Bacillus cereus group]MDX6045519.1 protein-export chaperone SecB [Bacillus paranthracis]PFL36333.1 hypothetical protein COJ06_17875 [Bacillus cereus]PGQ68224.1 hypothetical protein COA27_23390 [Bacillus cereus]